MTEHPHNEPQHATADQAEEIQPEAAETGLAAEEEREELLRQLEEKNAEAQQNYDRMLRLAAELENLKKRQERERSELVLFANESLIKELLPVIDNLERAIEHGQQQETAAALLEGVEMVLRSFLQVLSKFGVTQIKALGDKFDPVYHNAVMQEENSEVEDQTIIKELQKGYLLQGRLLRPAMVVVARNPEVAANTRVDVKV